MNYIVFVVKREIVLQSNKESPMLCSLTNILYHVDNHKYVFSSKIPDYIVNYLTNQAYMSFSNYPQLIKAFLNLAQSGQVFAKFNPDEVYKWICKLRVQN